MLSGRGSTLTGQRIAVVDGLSGIGQEIARLVAGQGGAVLVTSCSEEKAAAAERHVAAYELCGQVGPGIPADGSIVLFSSGSVDQRRPNTTVQTAAFAVLESLAIFLAVGLAPKVRVNVVRPGMIDTPPHRATKGTGEIRPPSAALACPAPLGRISVPSEVDSAATLLMTNTYIVGTVLAVSGGFHLA